MTRQQLLRHDYTIANTRRMFATTMLLLLVGVATILTPATARAPLHCHDGWQIWDAEPVVNNATIVLCGPQHNCCFMVSSLSGIQFGCYDACPSAEVEACGPDPSLGIQDLYFCYCRDHLDARCRPFKEGDDKRK